MNVKFWQDWFKWAQETILALAKKGDMLGLAAFCAALGTTVESLISPLESLAACFKGNLFTIAARLFAWAKANPDPLANFRHAAVILQQKYGNVANG